MTDYHRTLHWHGAWPCDNPNCVEATHSIQEADQ